MRLGGVRRAQFGHRDVPVLSGLFFHLEVGTGPAVDVGVALIIVVFPGEFLLCLVTVSREVLMDRLQWNLFTTRTSLLTTGVVACSRVVVNVVRLSST